MIDVLIVAVCIFASLILGFFAGKRYEMYKIDREFNKVLAQAFLQVDEDLNEDK